MNPLYTELAARYGTPFYAYDLEVARRRVQDLTHALAGASPFRLLYSFKSNPLPALAREFREGGCEADMTSEGELASAAEAGFDFSRALFGGPGKTRAEILAALEAGVRQFSVESWRELDGLAEAARSRGVRVRAILRINPKEAPRAKLAMSGVASQFGFEEEALLTAKPEHLKPFLDAVSVEGVHVYWGSQIAEVDALAACFRAGIDVAERVSEHLRFPLQAVNLGGGFSWPWAVAGSGIDLSPLREALSQLRAEAGPARDAEWWFESGRYLSASSGTLVARVMDLKTSKDDKRYLVLDTGIHHLGGMSGLGRIPRPVIHLDGARPGEAELAVDVVGPLCSPLDCLARNLKIGDLRPGDLIAIPNTGAYGLTASLTHFLSRPAPVEITHRDGQVISAHRLQSGYTTLQS